MSAATPLHYQHEMDIEDQFWSAVYQCPGCRNFNVARQVYHPWEDVREGDTYGTREAADAFRWASDRVEWVPKYGASEDFPDVPPHIASAATEATLCFSVGAYRAVGSLARAVVEASAKDKDASGANLAERIDALTQAGHVRPLVREAAHEIRHFGNNVAHGDFTEATSEEEAAEALALMREVLTEVYQAPARVAAAQQRRHAAKIRLADSQGNAPS